MNRNSRYRNLLVFAGFAMIAAFLLLTEHRARIFGILPFAFLLACPLLHVFMHGGHGSKGSRTSHGHRPDDLTAAGANLPDGNGDASTERRRSIARQSVHTHRETRP